MPCHLRRRPTQRSSTTPICPPGGPGTGRWRCRCSSTIPSIASSSLRALDTDALATNVTVFRKRCTKGLRKNNLVELASHLHTIAGRSSIAKSSTQTRLRLRFRSIARGQIWCKSERQFYQVILAQTRKKPPRSQQPEISLDKSGLFPYYFQPDRGLR